MTETASETLTAAEVETIAHGGGLVAGRAGGHRPTLPLGRRGPWKPLQFLGGKTAASQEVAGREYGPSRQAATPKGRLSDSPSARGQA